MSSEVEFFFFFKRNLTWRTFQSDWNLSGGICGHAIDPMAGQVISKLAKINSLWWLKRYSIGWSKGSSASKLMSGGWLDLSCTSHSAIRLIPRWAAKSCNITLVGCTSALLAFKPSEDWAEIYANEGVMTNTRLRSDQNWWHNAGGSDGE